ncbi:MAG: MBL fold metallo-hydrolase [Candidatus Aenigmarchaeota archaeon]|nr:MBL fold metallo-hydrolase [Candidatus Aenigmarchaeota archaeon]
MKITKLGHCCLLIKEKGVKILTDPGIYSTDQIRVRNLDVILITHEHTDHLHIDSLKTVLKNNSTAKVYTNRGVGKILDKEGIKYDLLENKQSVLIDNVLIEGFGEKHAEIYPGLPTVVNTCYFIANKLFYPGDFLYNPKKPVKILALPVAGPWLKLSEAVNYAKEIKPEICFPVHDGMLKPERVGSAHTVPEDVLKPLGIKFLVLKELKEIVF